MASGMSTVTFKQILNATYTGFAGFNGVTSHKIALVNATYLSGVNYDTQEAWSNSNEVTGTNWVTTGYTLGTVNDGGSIAPTLTTSPATVIKYAASNVARTATTIANLSGCVIYADAVSGTPADPIFVTVDFGQAYSTNGGTLGINWAAGGIWTLDIA